MGKTAPEPREGAGCWVCGTPGPVPQQQGHPSPALGLVGAGERSDTHHAGPSRKAAARPCFGALGPAGFLEEEVSQQQMLTLCLRGIFNSEPSFAMAK